MARSIIVALLCCLEFKLSLILIFSPSTFKSCAGNALFIFGDSSVDNGNNNHIKTTSENQAHYNPYGLNAFFQQPTGRFSDGRIIVDYIAEYAKLPLIPAFLQPSADYSYGVNFASGGAGVLPETNEGIVIDLPTQLRNFQVVASLLTQKMGDEEAKKLIAESVYFISIGSNDYMHSYLSNPRMQEVYTHEEFVGIVIGNLTQAIQWLYEKGARKFGFLGLCPLGCLPALRALNNKEDATCLAAASSLALAHNTHLSILLTNLEHVLKDFNYSNSNFYYWLADRINHPSLYGFKDGVNACCGSGIYRGTYSCGGRKRVKEYELCENPDDHVWWDSVHATERIHEQFAKVLWNGPESIVSPYNLQQLFFDSDNLVTIGDLVDDATMQQQQHFF